jgi:site-specific recombinase XerC
MVVDPFQEQPLFSPSPATNPWIEEYYQAELRGKNDKTVDAYLRILRQVADFVAQLPGSSHQFHPRCLTKTAFGDYVQDLIDQGYSTSHMERVKTVVNGFANRLIAQGAMKSNPTRGITIPAEGLLAPRELSKDQRFVLRNLIGRTEDLRAKAIFALGYWAGCRVSDVSHLLVRNVEIGPKIGRIRVGYKGGKLRDIVLLNQARGPLYEYLRTGKRARESAYVFTSQRETRPTPEGEQDGWRLSEAAIHEWFKRWKLTATQEEWDYLQPITFHDLRHDFAHRAKGEAGLSESELAIYLGHITKRGTPALQTTARYTQPSQEQIREKLKQMKGE